MPSFGEKLKLEREKRKITLEEISASTKIGTRMLQALEEEKFNQLPGGIFNKGFVRAYARMVGLDEDQAVADYLQASGDVPPAGHETMGRDGARDSAAQEADARENEARISRLEAISDSPSRPLPWGVFAVILLLIALALSLWSHRYREQQRLAAHTAPPKTAVDPTAPPAAQASPAPANTASTIQPSSAAPSADAAPTSPATSNPEKPPATPEQNASNASAPTPTSGEFTVAIHARQECWISITVDHKTLPSETLEPGNDRIVHGRKEVFIKAGNAGALDIQLNGKKLDTGGDFQQVKTITIGPAGLLPSPPNSSPSQ